MVKGNPKSSASSATRKKHAKKQQRDAPEDVPSPASKNASGKSGKGSSKKNKEPKVKMYIPPIKPAPVQPDPLETTGLGKTLPPDLAVVLRGLGKKASITKTRALKELHTGWVEKCKVEEERDVKVWALMEMVPVWLHHLPTLLLSPSRRVRLLSSTVHSSFLAIPDVGHRITEFVTHTASETQAENILGTWLLAANDVDRQVSGIAGRIWKETVLMPHMASENHLDPVGNEGERKIIIEPTTFASINSFIQRTALDPSGVYLYFNPVALPVPLSISRASHLQDPKKGGRSTPSAQTKGKSTPGKGSGKGGSTFQSYVTTPGGDETPRVSGSVKCDEQEESEADRKARLRIAAFGSTRWLLGNCTTSSPVSELFEEFFSNLALWTSLNILPQSPWLEDSEIESFGFAQPGVRKAAWGLVQALLASNKETLRTDAQTTLATAILRSAWIETDTLVQSAMWQPLLVFLQRYPQSWLFNARPSQTSFGDAENAEEDDDDPDPGAVDDGASSKPSEQSKAIPLGPSIPQAYLEYLYFLSSGCQGSPIQGFPTIVLILSTIPSSILFMPPTAKAPVSTEQPDSAPSMQEEPPPRDGTTPLVAFFDSLWSSLSSRALSSLNRPNTHAAVLSALLECLVFLVRKVRKSKQELSTSNDILHPPLDADLEERLVVDQLGRVWSELELTNLKADPKVAATQIVDTLKKLTVVDESLGDAAWEVVARRLKGTASDKEASNQAGRGKLVATSLKVFVERSNADKKVDDLLKDVLWNEVARIQRVLASSGAGNGDTIAQAHLELLIDLLEEHRQKLWLDEALTSKLDELLLSHAYTLLNGPGSQLVFSYLNHRGDQTKALYVWHALLMEIASFGSPASSSSSSPPILDFKAIKMLLSVTRRGQLPPYLRPKGDELDVFAFGLLEGLLVDPMTKGGSEGSTVLEGILDVSDLFITSTTYYSMILLIITTFTSCIHQAFREDLNSERISTVNLCFDLIQPTFETLLDHSNEQNTDLLDKLMPSIFLHDYLLPLCLQSQEGDIPTQSQPQLVKMNMWDKWVKNSSLDDLSRRKALGDLKKVLQELVCDVQVTVVPQDIIRIVNQHLQILQVDLLHDVFPSIAELDDTLDSLFPDWTNPSLALLDDTFPTSPSTSKTKSKPTTPINTDRKGFTSYSRVVNGLLQVFVEDRPMAKQNLWAVRHLLAMSVYAGDLVDSGFGGLNWNPVFGSAVRKDDLVELKENVKKLLVYLVNSWAERGLEWRKDVLTRLASGQGRSEGFTPPQRFLWDLIEASRKTDTTREARVLKLVLEAVLASGYEDRLDLSEADQWVVLAKKFEQTAPRSSISILSVLGTLGAEPPKLDRYRNELAASLLGIKPQFVNTTGLWTLRKLAACTPSADSDVVFLPTPRAVNVVKALQSWILAETDDDDEDNDVDEEVESAMLSVFIPLSPILQGVNGSHWPFIFDVLEGALERLSSGSSDSEPHEHDATGNQPQEGTGLVSLARALRLVLALEELSRRNKSLMEEWKGRRMNVLAIIRDLGVLSDHRLSHSTPLSTIRQLALSILQHLPFDLLDETTLAKLVGLTQDSSVQVQKTAYQLLQKATKKRTEHFVIEAGVDTEQAVKPLLPIELMEVIMQDVWVGDEDHADEADSADVFGYLLGWMLVFDSFADASFKVRSGYIEQLRDENVVVEHFIPLLLRMLQLNRGGRSKAFKLGIWAVDAFYVSLYEPGRPHALPVLTAHVYYRALLTMPSLILSWVMDCKDRQLTNAVTTYTSIYFSPVLIKAEVDHVRTHAVDDKLTDESLSIKVSTTNAGAVGMTSTTNEVIAAYSVDEHQLEIRIRIPSDWPLHRAEVKDVKRVGVDEDRWRAWVLGVQQTLWAHNGRIIDGLELFKKNVTLHFEGQVECAICYSIICVMDESLPKKPCKTCKNRFHASCLYKWFNSSHSSSCPLCRSNII